MQPRPELGRRRIKVCMFIIIKAHALHAYLSYNTVMCFEVTKCRHVSTVMSPIADLRCCGNKSTISFSEGDSR